MGEHTGISWTDHTFNPIWGCTRVSAGCVHCYAETWAKRSGVGWGPKSERRTFGDAHWREPLRWNERAKRDGVRRRVFCGSMCDVFEDHPTTAAQLPRLMALIYATPQLDWLLLTKRPERAAPWLKRWLADQDGFESPAGTLKPSWWLGTSVENQATADERIPHLLAAPAAVRFVSYEPALGPVNFDNGLRISWQCSYCRRYFPGPYRETCPCCSQKLGWSGSHAFNPAGGQCGPGIDWIIVGGESGAGARPFDLAWARSALDQCRAAGVAFFMKQLGAFPFFEKEVGTAKGGCPVVMRLRDRKGGDTSEWPEDLRVREFPAVREVKR